MSELGEAAAMAELARESLLAELLPHLPPEKRYAALMIANALGIASRELGAGAARIAAEAEDHRRLLGRDGTPAELRRTLAMAIRGGEFDDDPALVEALRREVAAALAIANPKYLDNNDKT